MLKEQTRSKSALRIWWFRQRSFDILRTIVVYVVENDMCVLILSS